MICVLVSSRIFARPFELLHDPRVNVLLFLKLHVLFHVRKMTCACKKKHKRGSGRAHFLSGVTWHKGSGKWFSGGGLYKKNRRRKKGSGFPDVTRFGSGAFRKRRKKKKGGMSMTGGGVNFSGSGFPISGGSVMRWVLNKKLNGRRVA